MTYVEDYVNRLKAIQGMQLGAALDRPVSRSDFANLILQRARSDFSVSGPPSMPKEKKKSLGQKAASAGLKVLDVISRPNYAVAEASDRVFNEDGGVGDFVKGLGAGISGKDKTSFIDVLQNQYQNDVREREDYQQIEQQYGKGAAENAFAADLENANRSPKAIIGGFITDVALDPLNLVGTGVVTKPLKALKGSSKTVKAEGVAEEVAATEAKALEPEASQAIPMGPGTGASQNLIDFIRRNKSQDAVQEVPTVQGNFASNRRPPKKLIEGEEVAADYAGSKSLRETIGSTPRFANLSDVHNRDLRASDFAKLQKARLTNETAQVVDQVAKGNPAALDLVTNKGINPLSPVARSSVTNAVNHVMREIREAIPDVVKAKAAGKQFRWPVNNAPTQNNLSNKLTNSARKMLQAESFGTKGGTGIGMPGAPKFIPAVFSRYMNMLKNAEEDLITRGRDTLDDALYPRGGTRPDSPYLRLSDVLETLPEDLAMKAILGPKQTDKVLPGIILKAITGNNAALGKIAKSNPALFDAIKNTDWAPLMVKEYATRTIDAANAAHKSTSEAANYIAAKTIDTASDAEKAGVIDNVVKASKKEFAKEMPEAKASLYDMLDGLRKSIPNPLPDPVDVIIERGKYKLAAAVFSGKNGEKVAQKPRVDTATSVNDSVLDEAGAVTKQAATDMGLAAKSAESGIFSTVLKWVDPASGYKDLRQLVLKNIGVRRASATTRAHEIIRTFGKVPEAEHMLFWDEVRTKIPPIASHVEAVNQMQKFIGNMFGESGVAEKFAGNTSLSRAGINLDHLNRHLKIVGIKDFSFINEVPDPLKPGKKLRLQGQQILDTWKNYNPKDSDDLQVFVYNLSQAVENAMVEYSTFSNLGAIWGKPAKAVAGLGYIPVSGMHPAINGMSFPKDIVEQMGAMTRGIDEMFEPLGGGALMQIFDQALRTWKTGVTVYAPSHHIRNMVGDVFMSYLDGVNNPIYYSKAGIVLKANHHAYSDIDINKNPLSDILGEGREAELLKQITGQSKTRIPKGTRVIAKARINGKTYPITVEQVYQMGFRHGIFPHSAVIEDLPGTETLAETLANRFHPGKAGPFAPFKGNVGSFVRQVSETREHYVRLAHFMHRIEHTKADSLEELFTKSANAVRKYHPDGLDLTQVEKKVFRRLMPFYSWTRKAVPLVLEGLVMNPKKIVLYPKMMSSIQEGQGQDSSVSDPWPDDQLFPDWLSSNVIGPVINPTDAFAKAISRSPSEVGYGVVNPGNPATDLMDQYLNHPIKGVANSINPFIKIPAEIAFGRDVQSGAPIDDKTEYIDKNIPLLSTASRLTNGAIGTGLLEGGDLKGKETEATNLQAFINYLTGAGILDTGRYQKGGEFDLKARIAEEKKNGAG